jgi:hypothetical protein
VRAALQKPVADDDRTDSSPLQPAWTVPGGPLDPWPGNAIVTVCPFGFRPVQQNLWFGPQSDVLLRRYATLLQAVLSLQVPAWKANTADQWRVLFSQLQSSLDPHNGSLARLLKAMQSLLAPMPNATNPGLDPRLKRAIEALANGNAGSLAKANVATMLASDPSNFANAKAFLYLHFSGGNGPFPQDLFSVGSEKLIGQSTADPNSAVRSDRSVETYRSMFQDPDPGGQSALSLVELLQEPRFDAEFAFATFSVLRISDYFERLGNQSATPATDQANAYAIPTTLLLPGGRWQPAAKTPLVWLAAREPVVKPVHLFTSRLPQLALQKDFEGQFSRGARLNYASLKRGSWNRRRVAYHL